MVGHRTKSEQKHHVSDHKSKWSTKMSCQDYMTFIVYICEEYMCRRNTGDLVWLILSFSDVCPHALLRNLNNLYTYNIQVSGHVLPRLIIH